MAIWWEGEPVRGTEPPVRFNKNGIRVLDNAKDAKRRKRVPIVRRLKINDPPLTVRDRVALRDGLVCSYCGVFVLAVSTVSGAQPDPNMFTVDHVVPTSRRGRNHESNCVVACYRCNFAKGDRTPLEWLLAQKEGSI